MNKELLAKPELPKGTFISTEGPPKTGKTELGLSMPDPLFILDLNMGLEGPIDKHLISGREIYVKTVPIPMSKDLPGQPWGELKAPAVAAWKEAITTLQEAINDTEIKSIFIDMHSEAWDLLRIARLGKLAQVLPVQYAAVNAEFRQLNQWLLCSKKNVMVSHKVKPEYVNDVRTNRLERAGFNDIAFDAKVVVRTDRDPKAVGVDQFITTILDCRANREANGKLLRGTESTFAGIMKMVYPNVAEENWK